MVRKDQHDHHPSQLPHPGHVRTLQRQFRVHEYEVQSPPELRPLHLCIFHLRNGCQGHRHGLHRQGHLPGRSLEHSRFHHRHRRVNFKH